MGRGGEDLCRACGACCNGTFFHHVVVDAGEVERVRHLSIYEENGETWLPQPCAAHRGDHCGIYADRPQKCAAYRCRLLERLEGGEVQLADALRTAARVRALSERVNAAWPAGADSFDALLTSAANEAWRRAHADILMDIAELAHLMRRRFGVNDKRPAS
jgi:uncharacterized protein